MFQLDRLHAFGTYAARHLRKAPVRITLVDRRNFHLFQPLLYQVATAALNPGDIAMPGKNHFSVLDALGVGEAAKRHAPGTDMIDGESDGDTAESADDCEGREQPGRRGEVEAEIGLYGGERHRRLANLEGGDDARAHDEQDRGPARAAG